MVQHLLETTRIDLQNGGGIDELRRFQDHFTEYRIVVFEGLDCEDVIFDGKSICEKSINFLYDAVNRHYHVIANFTGAMVKRYVCKGCNKGCRSDVTHKYQDTCNYCMSIPPCVYTHVRIPCDSCNRTFRNQSCFDMYKTNKLKSKTLCEQKRNCANCGSLLDPNNSNNVMKG